jgi:hypothetical protein
MSSQIGFILKVFLVSLGLSLLIKYSGKFVSVAPTTTNALIGISIIPLLMIFILGWRYRNEFKNNSRN